MRRQRSAKRLIRLPAQDIIHWNRIKATAAAAHRAVAVLRCLAAVHRQQKRNVVIDQKVHSLRREQRPVGCHVQPHAFFLGVVRQRHNDAVPHERRLTAKQRDVPMLMSDKINEHFCRVQ